MKSLKHGALLAPDTAQIHFGGTISAPTCSTQTSNITIDIVQIDKAVAVDVGAVTTLSARRMIPASPIRINDLSQA